MHEKTFLLTIIFIISSILITSFVCLNYRFKKKATDYYVMFIVGIAWIVLGILFKIGFLVAIGVLFSIVGYLKNDSWEKTLLKQNKKEAIFFKKEMGKLDLLLGIIIFIGVLVLLGIILYLYF